MPPFRAGLLKRKTSSEDSKSNSTKKESSENESDDLEESDLFRGDLDDANDVTDSEPEPDESGAVGSDQELERVMFEDADSNLGDEEDLQDSDQSSICDSELNILCMDSSSPGSAHDSMVWQGHPLSHHLRDLSNEGEQVFLLGDSGYPLRATMMTPILNTSEGTPEHYYYQRQVSARNVVERCIGVLKARFRCLLVARALHYDPITAAKIVSACCVLHNIANQNRVPLLSLTPEEADEENQRQHQAEDQIRENVRQNPQNRRVNPELQRGRALQQALVERLWRERLILTDSEADEEDGDDDDESEEEESGEGESADSGAESGPSRVHSSDEAGKKLDKENKQKPTSKVQKQTKKAHIKAGKETKTSVDRLTQKIKESSVSTLPVEQKDEYESGDTSDEEDRRNTTGDVPRWWYDEYPHVGYDLDARRLLRPPRRDQIDDFLKRCEDPEFWRTVRDPSTGQDVMLSAQDLELIRRIRQGHVPDASHDEYQPWVEWFSRSVLATPLRAFPEHKRSFLPSRSEQQQVSRIVHALKMGWTKTRKQIADERRKNKERKFYDLWGAAAEPARGVHKHIPAPRRKPPAHAESYNPPPEYLLDHKEMKEWNKLEETPWKRKYTFLPQRHSALRAVPAYARFVRERFLRCLDLYLAPRAIKMRLTISAKDLVPVLPSPRELQPFPTAEALVLRGHAAAVRSIDTDPSGQYAVSGSDDGTLKVWEMSTGRCVRTVPLGAAVARVCWGPAPGLSLVAAAAGRRLLLLNPGAGIGAHRVAARTDRLLDEPPPHHDVAVDPRTASCVQWERVAPEDWARGVRVQLTHFKDVIHASWHARGDYVCVTLRDAMARGVAVHQLSRRRSQLPFRRAPGLVQAAMFHPTKPLLFITTQRAVRIYDLSRQELVRKLQPGAQWNSAAALHPGGDNLLVASYDSKCMWFDLELSARPYQSLRLHGRAARAACFHRRYPLFATGGDDRYIVVSHGMVYNDLLQNPLLVPLKQLPSGAPRDGLVTLDLRFHPTQPWLLAACADGTIRLYS